MGVITPIAGWFIREIPIQMDDNYWGYPHFRKPPFGLMGKIYYRMGPPDISWFINQNNPHSL